MIKKSVYEKPELKGEKLFEAGAKTCCKDSACGNTEKNSQGKTVKTDTTS